MKNTYQPALTIQELQKIMDLLTSDTVQNPKNQESNSATYIKLYLLLLEKNKKIINWG